MGGRRVRGLQPSSRARKKFGPRLTTSLSLFKTVCLEEQRQFCDFVWKALRFNEIFQGRKDKRTKGAAEGRGYLAKVLPGGGGGRLENRQAPQPTKYT